MFMTFLPCYDIVRLFELDFGWFIAMYAVINNIAAAALAHWKVLDAGKYVFGSLIGIWVIMEVIMVCLDAGGATCPPRKYWSWYALVVPTFLVAFLLWILSKTGGVLCKPTSWL